MSDDKQLPPEPERRSGSDRRSMSERRRRQELFNSGKDKFEDRRHYKDRRKGPRRIFEQQDEEW